MFDDPEIEEIRADDLLGEYPAVQYVPPEGDFHLDILTRLGEMFRFETLEVQRLPSEGLLVNDVDFRAHRERQERELARLGESERGSR